MLRRLKQHSKFEVVEPKEEEEAAAPPFHDDV